MLLASVFDAWAEQRLNVLKHKNGSVYLRVATFMAMHRSSVWHSLASDIQHTTDTVSTDTGQVMLVQAPRDACCFTMFHLQVRLKKC